MNRAQVCPELLALGHCECKGERVAPPSATAGHIRSLPLWMEPLAQGARGERSRSAWGPLAAVVLTGHLVHSDSRSGWLGPRHPVCFRQRLAGLGGDLSWIRWGLRAEPPTHTQRRQESCEAGRRQGPGLITVALSGEPRCVGVCATNAPGGTSQELFPLLTPFLLCSRAAQTPSNNDGQLQ